MRQLPSDFQDPITGEPHEVNHGYTFQKLPKHLDMKIHRRMLGFEPTTYKVFSYPLRFHCFAYSKCYKEAKLCV